MEKSSKGLIPFIKLNDYVVEDSQKCIEYLSAIFKIDYNSHLTDEEKATARLVVKLCDDSLKWYVIQWLNLMRKIGKFTVE